MVEPLTYPLDTALDISSVWGAIFITQNGDRIRIDPVEDWVIWLNGALLQDIERSEAAARAWLDEHDIPVDRGWLPEMPLYVADGRDIVRIEDDRFEQKDM